MYHTVFPAPLMGHHFLPSKWCSLPIIWFVSGSVQFNSVAQSCPTLCNPMDCSMPGFPVHHQLSELAQTHVHWIGDAIQPSHLLLSPSPPAFNLSQHQGLFKWVSFRIRWPKYWSSASAHSRYCKIIIGFSQAVFLLQTFPHASLLKEISLFSRCIWFGI